MPPAWILNDFQRFPEDAAGKAMAAVVGRHWWQHGSDNCSLETPHSG